VTNSATHEAMDNRPSLEYADRYYDFITQERRGDVWRRGWVRRLFGKGL